jgi:hypothetical protein
MKYWRIIAGHEEIRSQLLGDWLREEYISIWSDRITKSDYDAGSRRIRDEMEFGDKVVVVADGCVWAIGEIIGPFKQEKSKTKLYPNYRDVRWSKVCKREYRNFPKSIRSRLRARRPPLTELNSREWETLITCLY